MDATPHTLPRRNRVTQNISLSPEEQRMAKELAERKHGGNVSRLFQKLLNLAWAMEQEESERKVA
jgi:hypothetical protein